MSFHQRFLKTKNLHFPSESNASVQPEKLLKGDTFNTSDACAEGSQVKHKH